MLERNLESWSIRYATKLGIWTRKFKSPSTRSVPDRIFAYQGRVIFIEFKAPGKKVTPNQEYSHQQMRDVGLTVKVINSQEKARKTLDAMATP